MQNPPNLQIKLPRKQPFVVWVPEDSEPWAQPFGIRPAYVWVLSSDPNLNNWLKTSGWWGSGVRGFKAEFHHSLAVCSQAKATKNCKISDTTTFCFTGLFKESNELIHAKHLA